MKHKIIAIALLLALGAAPAWAENSGGSHAQNKGAQVSHHGSGKVISIDREKLKIKLEHEPIPSLDWPGMTMDFVVTRAALLDKLKPGAQIDFTLVQGDKPGRWVIDQITVK